MPKTLCALSGLALFLLPGAALAQDDPETVGISVDGVVVEVAIATAAEACGIDAETLRAEWAGLGAEVGTMADTTVNADATDMAPDVTVDTAMDSTRDGVTVSDGADATHGAEGEGAADLASDSQAGGATTEPGVITDAETVSSDGTAALGTPTEGTTLSKAAVCEISRATAERLAIPAAD